MYFDWVCQLAVLVPLGSQEAQEEVRARDATEGFG